MRAIPATVYLVHFSQPFKHARHYIGYTALESVEDRIDRHRAGQGARLLRAVAAAGIAFEVVRTWSFKTIPAAKAEERRLKRYRGGAKLCPVCKGISK